jgi:hypothetical protein
MSYQTEVIVLFALSIAAGLVSLSLTALVAALVQRRKRGERAAEGPDTGEKGVRWTAALKSRYVLLTFPLGFALAFYLILDRALSVSVYPLFVGAYATFWSLAVLLLLWRSPVRHKLTIAGFLIVVVVSVRFVDWNSRKPFLKDLYRVKEGMTAAQVEQIMGEYMTGGGVSVGSPGPRLDGRLAEPGAQATGTISYRHTNEGWGDSDWGIVTFEDGRVVDVEFSPD